MPPHYTQTTDQHDAPRLPGVKDGGIDGRVRWPAKIRWIAAAQCQRLAEVERLREAAADRHSGAVAGYLDEVTRIGVVNGRLPGTIIERLTDFIPLLTRDAVRDVTLVIPASIYLWSLRNGF